MSHHREVCICNADTENKLSEPQPPLKVKLAKFKVFLMVQACKRYGIYTFIQDETPEWESLDKEFYFQHVNRCFLWAKSIRLLKVNLL